MGNLLIVLIILRFLLVLSPQIGYIHPDEFFQTIEIAAGDILNTDVFRAWEFNSTMPLRSISFPYIIGGLPFVALKYLQDNSYINITSYWLLVLPRIWMTVLSLITDYSVHVMSKTFEFDSNLAMKIYASSYITLVYMTRTFSNSLESVLLAVFFIVLLKITVVPENKRKESKSKNDQNPHLKPLSECSVFFMGILTTVGIFNRPTYLLFLLLPAALWFLILIKPMSFPFVVNHLLKITIMGVLGVLIACTFFVGVDTQYYRPDTIKNIFSESSLCMNNDFIQMFHCFKDLFFTLIIAPYNFLLYNTKSENLAKHGLHSRFLHILVNLPLLIGPLILPIFYTVISMILSAVREKFKTDIRIVYLAIVFISPVLLLSIFVHQEPRFLIPIVPVGCVLVSGILGTKKGRKLLWSVWIVFNVLMTLFYGYLHQGGIVPSLLEANDEVAISKQPTDHYLVFYKTYMPPRYLVTSNRIKVIDFGSSSLNELSNTIHDLRSRSANSSIQVFAPATVFDELKPHLTTDFKMDLICPHLSTENPPDFMKIIKTFDKINQHLSELCIHIIVLGKN
ncbi:GPI mannosyltransferase 4 [Patella vulgata]|uniref:GPI mannosyltransferase 4 n=1 Tax=Patella vulgata TaxID=6465 RepID=UPI0021804ABE|nr:GPI mannosyltransferase 4 [Patella vulgata]